MFLLNYIPLVLIVLALVAVPFFLRRVVEPNEVHIVQTRGKTKSYGRGQAAGNSYYDWPSWLPVIGIQTSRLPLSVFDLMLDSYSAYDVGRVPFEVDIMAFFRIEDPNHAAERVSDIEHLKAQLKSILQGAARSILAKADVEQIMSERGTFGDAFTKEVDAHLKEWGVCTVKSIELMDIRDAEGSKTISNIMAKKQSQIDKESRVEVAGNQKTAATAEIAARRDVEVAAQEAAQQIGQRTAMKDSQVGQANEKAKQEIATEAATTAERNMAVQQVNDVRQAEIAKNVQVVQANQAKETAVIRAEGDKQQQIIHADGEKQKTILIAEGTLEAKQRESTGIQLEGTARADAEKQMQLAREVAAQAALAETIGESKEYQDYLIKIRQVEAVQIVGVEQAKALTAADIRVVVQGGSPGEGLENVMQLFSAKGGQTLGTMLETFAQTPVGEAALKKLGIARPNGEARP